jgi:hypothetical protein
MFSTTKINKDGIQRPEIPEIEGNSTFPSSNSGSNIFRPFKSTVPQYIW